jgi:hypothetical protein
MATLMDSQTAKKKVLSEKSPGPAPKGNKQHHVNISFYVHKLRKISNQQTLLTVCREQSC